MKHYLKNWGACLLLILAAVGMVWDTKDLIRHSVPANYLPYLWELTLIAMACISFWVYDHTPSADG